MQDFSKVKDGDMLWSIQLGWCSVVDVDHISGRVRCENTLRGYQREYGFDGKVESWHAQQSLFFSEPEIDFPEPPRRKVKKIVYVGIDQLGGKFISMVLTDKALCHPNRFNAGLHEIEIEVDDEP